jgi:hypothetical protein
MPERELLPDPFDIDQDQLIKLAPAEKICDDTTIVFVHFLDNLLKLLTDKEALGVRIYLLNQFPNLRLDELRKAFLRDWLDKRASKLPVSYELNVMRQLINFAYVAMCELKGPVKADQLLSQAIKSSDELAKQMEIPLHDFL